VQPFDLFSGRTKITARFFAPASLQNIKKVAAGK